jgi:CRP/FNR family cyclic AMP-dependent transcriptional regulator
LNAPPDVALIFKPMSESKSQSRAGLEKDVAVHPFLIGLPESHIRLLTDCAMRAHFRAQEVIFREGETANRFYLIESGKVALESAQEIGPAPVVIDTIGPGDLLGWSWIFSPQTWHFTGRAVEPTKAIFFYGTILREGSGARLRVVQANEGSDDAPIATRAGPARRGDEKNGAKEIISHRASLSSERFEHHRCRRRMPASRRNFKLSIRKREVILRSGAPKLTQWT